MATDPIQQLSGSKESTFDSNGQPADQQYFDETGNVSVVSADAAKTDYNKKQTDLNNITQGLATQNQNNAATAQAAKVAADQKAQLTKEQAQKQAEIDAKNKATNVISQFSTKTQNTGFYKNPTTGQVIDISKLGSYNPQDLANQGFVPIADPNAATGTTGDNNGTSGTGSAGTGGTGTAGNTGTDNTGSTGTGSTPATPGSAQDLNNQQSDIVKQQQAAMDKYQSDVNSLNNGTFPLTEDEQAQVNSMNASFEKLKQDQQFANQNYTSGITQLGIVSGRSRYAPELETGNIANAVNVGLAKINDIESQRLSSITALKKAFKDDDYKKINDLYDKQNKFLEDKSAAIANMAKNINDEAKRIADANKAKSDELNAELNRQKTTADMNDKQITNLAPQISQYIKSGDKKSISDMAKFYGLDESSLIAAGQKYADTESQKGTTTQKYQQQMSEKGWTYVNTPAQRDSLKKQGWTIQQGADGKTYAKAPLASKITTKTVKVGSGKTSQTYLITYKDGIETGREKMGGYSGGVSSGASGAAKTTAKTAKFDKQTASSEMEGAIKSQLGPEGKISKEDWGTLLAQWENAGGTKANFIDNFSKYANPNYDYDYQGLPKVK